MNSSNKHKDSEEDKERPAEDPSRYLVGYFLIAMPQLTDPNFAGSLIFLWRHSEEGALGLVVNKPSTLTMDGLFSELSIETSSPGDPSWERSRVLAGGPVEQENGFILHDSTRQWEATEEISRGISLTVSEDILMDIAVGKGPPNYLVTLGCAGWEAGQLEHEIAENVWLTVPSAPTLLFSRDYENKSAEALALLGISVDQLSTFAGHS